GAGSGGVFRASDLEKALEADFRSTALARCRIDPDSMMSDHNGTPEYRANLVMVMARRAMENLGTISVFKWEVSRWRVPGKGRGRRDWRPCAISPRRCAARSSPPCAAPSRREFWRPARG